MRIDDYLLKEFHPTKYNCWDFTRDVWKELTGTDLGQQTPSVHTPKDYTDRALQVANTLTRLDQVADPCIVLFQRRRISPHVGVYYRGRVLHLDSRGAKYLPLDQVSATYTTVTYYQ